VATVGANVTTYSDLSVAASTTYTYSVEAFNSSGSAASTPVNVTTPAATGGSGKRRLNGTSDYVDFPSAPQVSTTTIAFFFTPQSLPATGERDVLVTYGEQGQAEPFGTHDKQLYLAPDGTLTARVYAGGVVRAVARTRLQPGQRYHVALTSSSSTLTIYVNGVAEGTAAASGSYNGYTNPTLRLGGLPASVEAGTTARRANGDFTALGEWQVALTAAQIASLASGTAVTAVQPSNLAVAATLTDDPPVADAGGPIVLNGTTFVTGSASLPSAPTTLAASRGDRFHLRRTAASARLREGQ
jgi:hypothetical protein